MRQFDFKFFTNEKPNKTKSKFDETLLDGRHGFDKDGNVLTDQFLRKTEISLQLKKIPI